ncbi:MAG TPA: RNA-binding protein [bacterium]|nr:RNA-binding protein [bacterium]
MSKKLYVGGLAWATDNESLKTAFAEFGEVLEANVITDRDTGRSRGFGFVTMADDDGAKAALELNGAELDGRTIRVDIANEKRSGGGGGGGGRFGGGGGGGRNRY